MRRIAASCLALVLLLVPGPSLAHSLLLESSPAAGSTIAAAPPELTLRFNNRIEKHLSRVRLVRDGVVPRDLPLAPGGAPDRLTAALPAIAPGKYRVEWQVLSTDGHVVTGRFSFNVKP